MPDLLRHKKTDWADVNPDTMNACSMRHQEDALIFACDKVVK